jgi:hypothetical protein
MAAALKVTTDVIRTELRLALRLLHDPLTSEVRQHALEHVSLAVIMLRGPSDGRRILGVRDPRDCPERRGLDRLVSLEPRSV